MTDIQQIRSWLVPSEKIERYNPSVFIGWRGLIRLLVFFNILGLFGLLAGTSHSAGSLSELLLAPISTFAGEKSGDPAKPITAPLLATNIQTTITGHIVRTTVIQTFSNPSGEWMEGVYYFPLPDDAAVDHMMLKIGERKIVSQIQEKQQARQTYLKAAAEGKVSALLTQYRPNVFSTRVANIEPNGQVSVEISFQALASQNGAEFTWRMPQAITPRYTPQEITNTAENMVQKASLSDTPDRQFPVEDAYDPSGNANPSGFDIRVRQTSVDMQIESPSHQIIAMKGSDETRISLKDGIVPADRDFVLKWRFAQSDVPTFLLFEEKRDTDIYSLGLLVPPAVQNQNFVISRDITFIIDVSGSMHGTAIEQGKEALKTALHLLRPGDFFDIIAFNDQFVRLFSRSEPVSENSIAIAKKFVAQLQADNGTEMYPALESALLDRHMQGVQRQILFLTDGAVGNEQQMFELVNQRLGDARLFTVGLGSAPNGWFMRKAAEFGRGIHVEIDDLDTAQTELEKLFHDMTAPTLEKIDVKLGSSSDIYPKIMPDLFGQRSLVFVAHTQSNQAGASIEAKIPFGTNINIPFENARVSSNAGIAKL